MFKRLLFGGATAGALTAAYLVGSLTLGGAFAQTSPTPTPTTQSGAPGARESDAQADAANEASEAAALASQAKITADQARAAALAKFPGATVGEIELENENGVVVYSVKLGDSAGNRQEVKVDATSGTVLSAHVEDAGRHGGRERPETAD